MSEQSICHNCIGETYLKNEIQQSGEIRNCDFCETSDIKTFLLEEIADEVHAVIEKYFYLTSSEPESILETLAARDGYWEQSGEPVSDVILNLLDTTDSVTEAIHDHLSGIHDATGKDALCDPQPYDSEAHYAEHPVDIYEFHEDWSLFKREIRKRARFFNSSAEETLKSIFRDIGKLKTRNDVPVICEYSSTDLIYRARMADSEIKLKSILENLPTSLGSPPHEFAKAGRMNADGIGVFYGATDTVTCINELRPPIGSCVVIGCFKPIRNLRLLDLSLLKDVYQQGSLFDAEHMTAISRQEFLKLLVDELSAPVMPGTESRDYLPTQLVAEFLAAQPSLELDGVIYNSSQIIEENESNEENKNIVLFPHTSVLNPYDMPDGTEISVNTGFGPPDDYDDSITIFEEHPEPKPTEKTESVGLFGLVSMSEPPNIDEMDFNFAPSIELDINSVEVHNINGVNYSKNQRSISRHITVEKKNRRF